MPSTLRMEPAAGARTNEPAARISIVDLLRLPLISTLDDRLPAARRLAAICWTHRPYFRTIANGPARRHHGLRARRGHRQLLGRGTKAEHLQVRSQRTCAAARKSPGCSPSQPQHTQALA